MKSILVIDTPSSCLLCPLNQNLKCGISRELVEMNNRPSWCPLKPLPYKKAPYFDPNANTYDEEKERSIMNEIDGYNRCIDEILGEK